MQLHIDVAVPDDDMADILTAGGRRVLLAVSEPGVLAPAGDRLPCHLFWAPPVAPLGPVLRPDNPTKQSRYIRGKHSRL